MKIALVVMPWTMPYLAPLGVATLKSWLGANGVEADCQYLNLKMAAKLGPRLAARIPAFTIAPEWLFSYHLFGPAGSGEIAHGWEEIREQQWFKDFLDFIKYDASESRVKDILLADIPTLLKESLEEIPWHQYDLIGFSSIFHSHAACLTLAREIKSRFPDKPVVLGGSNVEGEMGLETLRACPWIDYLVDGEGEEPLLALIRHLQKGIAGPPEIPRLHVRYGGKLVPAKRREDAFFDLDRLPTPNHDDYCRELERCGIGQSGGSVISFESSRGCWWGQKQHCTFCGLNGGSMTYRSKSPALVLRDLETLHRRHLCFTLQASDNIIGIGHLQELLPALSRLRADRGVDWTIFYEVKANLNPRQMRSLAEAGVTLVQPGIESLSTPILKLMRKGVRAIQNIQTLKLGQKFGIELAWNFLYGFPGEDVGEYARIMDIIQSLTHLQPPDSYGLIRVDRFSPYHAAPERFGLRTPQPQEIYSFLYPPSRVDLAKMAYYFDFDANDRPIMPYEADLRRSIERWQSLFPDNFFACVRGMDFIDLHDTRPLQNGNSRQWQSHRLVGTDAFLFNFCDTIKTAGEITAACQERFPGIKPEALRETLSMMASKRWMFQEDNMFLSLAIPTQSLTPSQQFLYQRMTLSRLLQ